MKVSAAVLLLGLVGCAFAPNAASPPHPPSFATATHRSASSSAQRPAKLIVDDEFNGSRLNRRIWSTCYPGVAYDAGCTNNPGLELEWYQKSNVVVSGGLLNLIATAQSTHERLPYTSGMISAGGWVERNGAQHPAPFRFEYGYAEIRAQLPSGAGMWPAFWLVPANLTWPPEIDIMEFQGVTPDDDIVTIHWRNAAGQLEQSSTPVDVGQPLSNGFHTYALDWTPNAVTWYFDGRAIKRYTHRLHIPHQPVYVILNLAIGGWLPGQLTPSPSSFPATFAVDYLRIWNRKP